MRDPFDIDEPEAGEAAAERVTLLIPAELAGERLDKALSQIMPSSSCLSRSRLQALIAGGQVMRESGAGAGDPVTEPKTKVTEGEVWLLEIPAPAPSTPQPQAIALDVIYEDAALIVIDKPAGMAVHPAPGTPDGTLVNALLAHCADTLSGIGGEIRPGIVHRIDKETSGLLVVAKNDAAHQGLAAQFADHSLERRYTAFVWGAPDGADPRLRGLPGVSWEPEGARIEAAIGRHRTDRKRMAVVAENAGRRAVTWFRPLERFGPPEKPFATCIECQLETGRTHQIRVHMTYVGHPLIGDPVYGRARVISAEALSEAGRVHIRSFPRQALHASVLGFEHPISGEWLSFESALPEDLQRLRDALSEHTGEADRD
ncbi:MAG: RluA family pseudouridine synthase [Neomegalonema sp.]|nr:RluA family pseudouridine synthase [Neomegalonema sp.]